MNQGSSGDHLSVQNGVMADQAVEVSAMPVRPIHHRGNAEAAIQCISRGVWLRV